MGSISTEQSIETLREDVMRRMVDEYTKQLPTSTTQNWQNDTSGMMTVLLTGSTGSLGSYLLHTLLSSSNVRKVYCLNRRADAATAQAISNADRGLISVWDERVEFLHADLGKEFLGLDEDVYERLKGEVTAIVHNQWPVHFKMPLSAFAPHITGVLNSVRFSASSPYAPPVTFISSIGTAWYHGSVYPDVLVPESNIDEPSLVLLNGYAESKWISERLLNEAGKRGVRCNVARIGLITGPVMDEQGRGAWNKHEWVPSIIRSSKYLGYLPSELPMQQGLYWIPVDIVPVILLEIISADLNTPQTVPSTGTSTSASITQYYNITNPQPSSWTSLVPIIQDFYASQSHPHTTSPSSPQIQAVSFPEWLDKLQEKASAEGENLDVEKLPAIKLKRFFRDLQDRKELCMDTTRAQQKSKTLREMGGVNGESMRIWLKQWEDGPSKS